VHNDRRVRALLQMHEHTRFLRLGCQLAVPPDEAAARGLFYEAGVELAVEGMPAACAALARSAHAPFMLDFAGRRTRVNVAALDGAWRRASMQAIEQYFVAAARYPGIRLVVVHSAPRVWRDEGDVGPPRVVGDYELLIQSLRQLADIARCFSLTLVLENNRAYWDGVPDDVDFASADRGQMREYFGTAPEQWLGIQRDVGRDNFGLCFDSSHAVTYAQRFAPDDRPAVMRAFLAEPSAICHVHWNDNDLAHPRGRQDLHLAVGRGTAGDDFHRAIRALAGVTRVLEHFYGLPALDEELRYIAALAEAE